MAPKPRNAYAASGVDYNVLDDSKRLALAIALGSSGSLAARGALVIDESRGEPAFVFAVEGVILASVLECLGTKSIIARQYQELTGQNRYGDVAYDTVAAIVNDLCCVGALPLVINAYFATGSADWYSDPGRIRALLKGWRQACDDAGCAWGGGESPTLPGLLSSDDIELAGSGVGRVPVGREAVLGQDLAVGDEIVLLASAGLHANGASLVRRVAERLDDGLLAEVSRGVSLGDLILRPSRIYASLVEQLIADEIAVTYLSHITGHGLLKLMRPAASLTYRIAKLPPVPAELAFIAEAAEMAPREAYGTLNMGTGYAVYCRAGEGARVLAIARRTGHHAVLAGRVEKGPRRIILEPVNLTFDEQELDLAAARVSPPGA
jgi:phosphoribosylformylglycinamidine cyclo-ligase